MELLVKDEQDLSSCSSAHTGFERQLYLLCSSIQSFYPTFSLC